VTVVESLRATIEGLGGEYRFQSKVTGLILKDRVIKGVRLENGEEIAADHVILAVAHSARDVFAMLDAQGVAIEAKPFSIGFRIEHPQSLIDQAMYGRSIKKLGAAEYRLVHHARNGRSVYSFCMCPGGTVVAARNSCCYGTESHAEFLRRASFDAELAAALRRDHTQANVSDADRAMLDYVGRLRVHDCGLAA